MLSCGPQLLPRTQRMTIAHEIAERVKERSHLEVFAIGHYGSLAREEDGVCGVMEQKSDLSKSSRK